MESGEEFIIPVIMKACRALGLDMADVGQALADDFIARRKTEMENWLVTRGEVATVQHGRLCHKCPFFHHSTCYHTLNVEGPRKVICRRWIGYVRPEWCPLGFPGGYEKCMGFQENQTIPVSMDIDGVTVTGTISDLSPKSFMVTIDSPYSGISDYPPIVADVVMISYELYSNGKGLTAIGELAAKMVLHDLYTACRSVDEHIGDLSRLYNEYREMKEAVDNGSYEIEAREKRRALRKRFRKGEIEKKEYDAALRAVSQEEGRERRLNYEKEYSIEKRFHEEIERITGLTHVGDNIVRVIETMKTGREDENE